MKKIKIGPTVFQSKIEINGMALPEVTKAELIANVKEPYLILRLEMLVTSEDEIEISSALDPL